MDKPQTATRNDEITFCRIIAEAYQKYYESFPLVSCKYRVIKGDAASSESALLGQYRHRITAPAVWYVDGAKVRVGVNPNLEEFSALRQKPEYTVKNPLNQIVQRLPMETLNVLDDGSKLLQEDPSLGIAAVFDASSRTPAVWLTPLDMGIMGWGAHTNPAKDIMTRIEEGKTCKLNKKAAGKLVQIEIGDKGERICYSFDPERQYALVIVETRFDPNGVAQEITKVLDWKEYPDGRIFPMRSITVSHRGDKEIQYDVQEIVVDHIDLVTKPSESEFQILLPKGTQVTDGISGITIKLAGNEKIDFNNMQSLLQRVQREVTRNKELLEQLDKTRIDSIEIRGRIQWLSVFGVLISVLLLYLSARLFRRQLSKT